MLQGPLLVALDFERQALRGLGGCGRGLAELDKNKEVKKLLLKDFPFAEDGLLVWNALVEYFTKYLNLYYSDSGADGKPKVSFHLSAAKYSMLVLYWPVCALNNIQAGYHFVRAL